MSEQVLPFYLVCDESYSMSGEPLDELNRNLPEIHREIARNPVVADKTRFSIVSFSDTAEVLVPLADLGDVRQLPTLQPSGGTSYGSAFTLLRDTIEKDIDALKRDGHQPYRPTIFFLTDGQPLDDWYPAYQRLTDPAWRPRPNILAFGFGQADAATLQRIATLRAFIASGSMSPAMALREFAKQLVNSIVKSATLSASNPAGGAQVVVPQSADGWVSLPADPV